MDDAYFQLEFGREPAYPYLYNHNPKNRRITQILNMMKRHLYVLFVLLVMVVLISCANKTDYLIKGSSSDFADGNKVYLFYLDTNEKPVFIDSTV